MALTPRLVSLLVIFTAMTALMSASAHANITLLDKDDWKFLVGGFIETDSITDSTRSFNEKVGNTPVARPDAANGQGQTGREQFSIRNSRLGFTAIAPEVDGWKSKGYFEFDFLGFDPSSGTAGNTEAGFYNNPTLRVRHAYLQADYERTSLLAGQTWALLGWQPYYFIPTVQVQAVPAMLYSRTAQFRVTHTCPVGEETRLQEALGIMRPPQRDSGLPSLEAGLRLVFDGWTGGFVGGSTPPDQVQPLSFAVSGTVREFSAPSNPQTPTGDQTHYFGHAVVADLLIPVIRSSDNKDTGNTFTIGGEFTTGTGYGDEMDSWTGGFPSPLNSATSAPTKNLNLDAGIGGYTDPATFQLVNLTTFNVYGQYHLPSSTHMWFSGGFGQLYSNNIGSFGSTLSSGSTGTAGYANGYTTEQVAFGNVMKDLTRQLRLGFEYAQIRTTYVDGTLAHDYRYQLSAFFIF